MKSTYSAIKSWDIDSSWTLFLDRDGVINRKLDGYVTSWENFSFLPKVPESLAIMSGIFHKICIVTNQQGIDKHVMTHEDLANIHSRMLEVVEYFGGRIDEIYYEPSLAVYDSFRRKPNPGMLLEAAKDFPSISLRKSILIGDSLSDIEAGHSMGLKTIWIENNLPKNEIEKIYTKCDLSIGGLSAFCGLLNE